jgi:hypothetical protein
MKVARNGRAFLSAVVAEKRELALRLWRKGAWQEESIFFFLHGFMQLIMVGEKHREESPRRRQCREMNMVVAQRCCSEWFLVSLYVFFASDGGQGRAGTLAILKNVS